MALALPRFYAIIDRSIRPERPLDDIARVLAEAGVRLIQLRAKQATSQVLLAEARRLLSLLPPDSLLIINDRADVADLAGAAGVHLGQDDLPVAEARALLGSGKLIGFSTHNPEQLSAADRLGPDYLAFGPIFPTASKASPEPVVGLEGLREARRWTTKPLVAIGGITTENAAAVLEAGADSVAVIGDWLGADDMGGRLKEFRRALGRLN
ncbi:MAG: thiamine phosphate synthase [Candidatus Acidiferrales bacterium]